MPRVIENQKKRHELSVKSSLLDLPSSIKIADMTTKKAAKLVTSPPRLLSAALRAVV